MADARFIVTVCVVISFHWVVSGPVGHAHICESVKTSQVKFSISTHRNKSGNWLTQIGFDHGGGLLDTRPTSPWSVDVEQRTTTTCDGDSAVSVFASIAGPEEIWHQGGEGGEGVRVPPGLANPPGAAGQSGLPCQTDLTSTGTPGPPGPPGPPGVPGVPGPPGPPGPTGPTGPLGLNGERGSPGFPGPKGDPGLNGGPGSPGSPGPKGDPGLNGQSGLPGFPGPKGEPGVTGTRGSNGIDGKSGPAGPAGAKGSTGAPGVKGEPGSPGPKSFRPDYELFHGIGFYKFHTDVTDWSSARQKCADEGAHLVIINSDRESDVIKTLFSRYPTISGAFHNNDAWIGLTEKDGTIVTILGHAFSTTGFMQWKDGSTRTTVDSGICLSVDRESGKLSYSWSCSRQLAYVCEHEL